MQCHDMVDGRAKCDDPALLMAHAQERTANRLREIAASPTLKPWKVEAARWALGSTGGKIFGCSTWAVFSKDCDEPKESQRRTLPD
jgi:hypothetical protein